MTMAAPSRTSASANARPMPRTAPVTGSTLRFSPGYCLTCKIACVFWEAARRAGQCRILDPGMSRDNRLFDVAGLGHVGARWFDEKRSPQFDQPEWKNTLNF